MELRHLRYFVAVAEEGSVTLAAERRLHTAQPSLSRQMRDLETEVGAQLLVRGARGIELTAAGRAFLDHARLALSQVEAAGEAARRVAHPAKASFVVGFLTGFELAWLPEAARILRDELPNIDVVISSQTSPELAVGLLRGKVDVAFLRAEDQMPDLAFKVLATEPLVAILPRDHRLAARAGIRLQDMTGEVYVGISRTAPVLRKIIEDYMRRSGVAFRPDHEADHLAMAMSLVASTGGIALLPLYAVDFLPPSLTSRPLHGKAPTIDLVLGYRRANASPLLKLFLSRANDLIARVSRKAR
ncbi:MAG TPA: LysR family transcriptional regulator [Stellaceae bacterium]|nr:LysR family transcriptional regulator [Stellaceae bacterium]